MENMHTDVKVLGVTATVILNYYHKKFHYCHERIGNYLLGCMQCCVYFFPYLRLVFSITLKFRFGSRCFRIFRLLLLKKHMEQKQVK